MDSNIKGIALCGHQGSGKTTTAISAKGLPGVLAEKFSFADALREEVAFAYYAVEVSNAKAKGYPPLRNWEEFRDKLVAEMIDPTTKTKWRPVLQAWGVMRRSEDEDYWLDLVVEELDDWHPEGEAFAIIDDCRFPNEYTGLCQLGFRFFRLEEDPNVDHEHNDTHESEAHWKNFTYYERVGWYAPIDRADNIIEFRRMID